MFVLATSAVNITGLVLGLVLWIGLLVVVARWGPFGNDRAERSEPTGEQEQHR
jgi:hypothetical protein